MSFSEKIIQLQSIYRQQHDLQNQIAGSLFAEERGHFSEDDRKELQYMQFQYKEREQEETDLREAIKNEFPDAYAQHLRGIQTKLTLIQNHLRGMQGELAFKHNFNKTICESLLSDLSKLIQNRKMKYDFNWLFDVSNNVIEEYKTTLKL